MNRIVESSRGESSYRSGSVTVMVLAVMLVVCLMVLQSSQLLVAFYRGDSQQRQLEQNRELIELGIAKAKIHLARNKAYAGEEFTVSVWDGARFDGKSFPERTGSVKIEIVNRNDGVVDGVRITARFPAGEPGEMVSTWESK